MCLTKETSVSHLKHVEGRKDSIVKIVTGLKTGQSRVHISAELRDFSLLRNFQAGSGVYPAFYSMGNKSSFPRGNAARAWG